MAFCERKRWVFFALPFTFTQYHIREDLITVDSGFLKRMENDCYMYKVQDVRLTQTIGERLFGLGSIICYTGDTTDPILNLCHIKNAKEIKNFILEHSELQRRKRRTISTMDIGAGDISGLE